MTQEASESSPGRGSGSLQIIVTALAFIFIAAVPLTSGILGGHSLIGGDWDVIIYPFRQFAQRVFSTESRLPFWNPYILGGMPYLASLNATILYPTELLSLPLNLAPETFYLMDCWLHLVLAAGAFFLWMRREGQGLAAAAAGGLAYALGGVLLTLVGAGQPHAIRSVALQPVIFLFLAHATHTQRLVWSMAAGLAAACCILTIGIQFAAYGIPIYLAWIMFFQSGNIGKRALHGLLMTAAAVGLGAVILVPGYEYQIYSIRGGGFDPEQAAFWQFTPWDTLSYLFPGIYGIRESYVGPHPFKTSSDHVGLIVLALAAVGLRLVSGKRRRWLVLALVALILAMGTGTIFGKLVAQLPLYSTLRASSRWVTFLNLALCVLAAYGLGDLLAGNRRKARQAALVLIVFSAVCLSQAHYRSQISTGLMRAPFIQERLLSGKVSGYSARNNIARSMLVGGITAACGAGAFFLLAARRLPTILGTGVVLATIAGELMLNGMGYLHFGRSPASGSPGRYVNAILTKERNATIENQRQPFRVMSQEPNYQVLANVRMHSQLHWVHGLHSLPLAGYVSLLESLRLSPGVLNLLNVRYIITDKGTAINPAALPRAFFASGYSLHDSPEHVRQEIVRPGWKPERALLAKSYAYLPAAGSMTGRGLVTLSHGRDEIGIDAKADGAELLVLSENWYPAWKAWLDGKRTVMLKPHGALRGVVVPPGIHAIRMSYDSWTFKLGLLISMFTVAATSVGCILANYRHPFSESQS